MSSLTCDRVVAHEVKHASDMLSVGGCDGRNGCGQG